MKYLLVPIFILMAFNSSSYGSTSYESCLKDLKEDVELIRVEDEVDTAIASGSLYVGYLNIGSASRQIKEAAILNDLLPCTKVSYGLFGRTIRFTIGGEQRTVEAFIEAIEQTVENYK